MADGRKRLSGFQYRKRKAEKDEIKKKLAGSLKKLIVSMTPTATATAAQPSTSRQVEPVDVEENLQITQQQENDTSDSEADPQESQDTDTSDPPTAPSPTEVAAEDAGVEIFKDPAQWPQVLTDKIKMCILEIGPSQLKNITFPLDDSNRSFSTTYYHKKLSNNENVPRTWLVYSKSNNSVFCFCCKLFKVSDNVFNDDKGYTDWRHLSQNLDRHEKSKGHFESVKKWVELKKSIEKCRTVDSVNQNLIQLETKRWTSVIERIICAIQYLAGQNLAFRGSNQKLFEKGNGNFLKLIESIAKFDNIMAEHIGRIQNDNNHMPHYLGHIIQNEIICLIGEKVKQNIIATLKLCKYYSIILDCTPDVSHEEQITVVVRFVFINDISKNVEIREHFLGFCPVRDTTGEGLTTFLLNYLEELDIDIKDMRGQGYDNGANMKGKHNGLQKRILDINPRAFFVPCAAHSLNLVINDAAKSSHEVTNFFAIVQEIYVFFSASTYRWHVLMKEVPTTTAKPLSDTRWESRIDAIKTLRFNLEKIYDALFFLYNDTSRDNDTKNLAKSLINKIKSYKFVCSLVIWYNILSKLNIVSKIMQKSNIILPEVVKMLTEIQNFFHELRSDSSFTAMLNEAKNIAEDIDCETVFPAISLVRPRKKKVFFYYEHRDEAVECPELNFKVNFYFYIVDVVISKLNDRFEQLNECNCNFGFLNNLGSLSSDKEKLMKYCMDLQIKLTDLSTKEMDVDAIDLCNEIEILSTYIHNKPNATSAKEVLEYLVTNDLINTFPNLSVALRIFLTMPVTVAHGERSFSKLKIIKNYLRSAMSQNRLTNLAMISIEKDICEALDMTDLIKEFATKKARKVVFNI